MVAPEAHHRQRADRRLALVGRLMDRDAECAEQVGRAFDDDVVDLLPMVEVSRATLPCESVGAADLFKDLSALFMPDGLSRSDPRRRF